MAAPDLTGDIFINLGNTYISPGPGVQDLCVAVRRGINSAMEAVKLTKAIMVQMFDATYFCSQMQN